MRSAWLTLAVLASQAAAAGLADRMPRGQELTPLKPAGVVESYTPDTLWERIDGEAEVYRRFGLTEAAVARFEHPADADRSLEISLFRLSSSLEAFGLFASSRPPRTAVLPFGNGGFAEDSVASLWHGEHFVHVYATGALGAREKDLRSALEAVTARMGTVSPRPPILRAFEGLAEPESVRYAPEHLLARSALPPGLEGRSRAGYRIFLATAPVEGTAVLQGYRQTLRQPAQTRSEDMEVLNGTDPDLGPVTVAVRGSRFAGVGAVTPEAEVLELLSALLRVEH